MSQTPEATNNSTILGTFASIVGLLGAALYFTGWTYRWAYYSFFELEVTSLDLPFESFLMVPIQVCLGNFGAFVKTAIAAVVTFILIRITLRFIHLIRNKVVRNLIFQLPIFDETVIVIWILATLFWLARSQGVIDARRDAFNHTSTLPVITIVTPENRFAMGRRLDNPTENPKPSQLRVIGDPGRYEQMLGTEINDPGNTRVWRLLIARNNYFYIFKALPSNATRAQRPPLIVLKESDSSNNLLILSPEATKQP